MMHDQVRLDQIFIVRDANGSLKSYVLRCGNVNIDVMKIRRMVVAEIVWGSERNGIKVFFGSDTGNVICLILVTLRNYVKTVVSSDTVSVTLGGDTALC